MTTKQVAGYLQLSGGGMPQDIRVSPDGKTFYIAEMVRGGVYTIDPVAFTETGFIPTGTGAHGLYPSRDAKVLYVANRGSSRVGGPPNGAGQRVGARLAERQHHHCELARARRREPRHGRRQRRRHGAVAGGPVRQRGRTRSTPTTGEYTVIPVGREPHGLAVWPQPGRYSLGHTGNMR